MAATTVADVMEGKLTDKNTDHTYADTYEEHFGPIKTSTKNVLEIGVYKGGSIRTWYEYFPNATITGIDIDSSNLQTPLDDEDRIKLVYKNAYCDETIEYLSDRRYDIIIDDGPHTLESMLFFAHKYTDLLTDDGILVIEDIQNPEWIPYIVKFFPEEYLSRVKVIDLRNHKNRYDDILIILSKKNNIDQD